MLSSLIRQALPLLLALPLASASRAQTLAPVPADTAHKYSATLPAPQQKWYRGKLLRATAVPALLIGYGISTIGHRGIYSSLEAREEVVEWFGPGRHTRADDFLQLAPYAELGGALLLGVESTNDRINLGLVILKSELLMGASVYAVKKLTNIDRPDGTPWAFPSGHTAQAFLAASIVHTELRDKSPWYGVGAYALATGVAGLRMVNNKHWESDVFAGAGFGILSAHLAYLSHRHRWGRKPTASTVRWSPVWLPGAGAGLGLTWQPGSGQ